MQRVLMSIYRRALASIDCLVAALLDPARRERTAVAVLASYAALWTLYGAVAKSSQSLHFDMGEVVAWSRELAWGYPKHPPLSAWVVKLWFSIMPLADWSFYLLAMIGATLGLWIAWKLAADYLDAEKRVAGLALLTFIPFFNFHALKFNANTILIPLWAATTWWFLRSFETRNLIWAALAGLAAAAAMLGKYWSIILLAALGIGALSDSRRRVYFRSLAPWVTVGVGLIAIAPHVYWLIASSQFAPFEWALEHKVPLSSAVRLAFRFLGGVAAFMAVPILIVLAATRFDHAAIRDTLWPPAGPRRMTLVVFLSPLPLAALVGMALSTDVNALWMMSGMTLLPVVLLSSPLVTLSRQLVVALCAVAVALPFFFVAVSPAIATYIHRAGIPNYAAHYQLIAQAIERVWRDYTDRPLRIVGSYVNVVNGAVPYLSDAPSSYDLLAPKYTPWVDDRRLAREGAALVCPVPEVHCLKELDRIGVRPGAKTAEVEITRSYLGIAGRPVRYRIVVIPPAP